MTGDFGRDRDTDHEEEQRDTYPEDDEGFDEDPDEVTLTPPTDEGTFTTLSGPDNEDDDEGFDEEPDWAEKDDDVDYEER